MIVCAHLRVNFYTIYPVLELRVCLHTQCGDWIKIFVRRESKTLSAINDS